MKARVDEALAEADKAHQVVLQNQRLEALGQLTGGVAHDFNNLLMVVSNYAYLLRARQPGAAQSPELAGIQRAVATGAKLTRQLLAFARRQPVRPEPVQLQARLPELVSLLKASLGSRVSVTCEVAADTAPVLVDPAEFELALINLAVNARDAMPDGGSVRVTAANQADGTVLLRVADTGTGIPADVLPRVFEPFFTTKPVGHGTGLGLSQVIGFAQQAGGTASIESSTPAGTVIVFSLPALRPQDMVAEGAQQSGAAASVQAGATVLLVEDNQELAAVTAQVLREAAYGVTVADSGDAARTLLESGAVFDVVLSDVRMPGDMDGIKLAQWLRSEWPALPVMLMTGYTAELEQARQLGLQVLPKPSPPDALLEALRRELAEAGKA
jgi:CheY-like chemotaxis protein